MKKILILLLAIFLTSFNKGYCDITIQNNGSTIVSPTQVSQAVNVIVSTLISLTLTVKVTALDQYITNTADATLKVPISQLYVNNGVSDIQMLLNTPVTTTNGLLISIGGVTLPYNFIIKNVGVLPPGTYTTRLRFEGYSLLTLWATQDFTLTFTIPVSQDVSTVTNPVNITLTPAQVFDSTAVVDNTTTPQIVVKSNDKWKLILDTTGMGTLQSNYFFTITGVSSNVTNYITAQTQLQPNQQYVLATGNATVSAPITGTYVTDYINLKYTLKNNTSSYIPEGVYNNYGTYKIQQGN